MNRKAFMNLLLRWLNQASDTCPYCITTYQNEEGPGPKVLNDEQEDAMVARFFEWLEDRGHETSESSAADIPDPAIQAVANAGRLTVRFSDALAVDVDFEPTTSSITSMQITRGKGRG